MALVHADSMDLYSNFADLQEAGYSYSGTAPTIQSGGGRFGGDAVDVAYRNELRVVLATSGNEIGIQAAFILEQLARATDEVLLAVRNNSGADDCFKLTVQTTGAIRLKDSAGATVVTTAAGVINEGTFHYLEVWATIANGGNVEVKVDGVQVINSAADTSILATDVDLVAFLGASDGSGNGVWWDDFIIMDGSGAQFNALLGDSRIDVLLPDADTAQEDWTLSAGVDSYALINDAVPGDHDGDATYIEDDTPANETRVDIDDLPVGVGTVHGVVVVTAMRKTDAGARTARALINSGGTEAVGTTRSPTTSYQTYRDYFELDPNAGPGAWTPAAVNALEIGVEVVA